METPGFDRLAEEGILFQNAYTPNAKCAPSRSSILTGPLRQLEEAANHIVNFPAKFKTFPGGSPGEWLPNGADGKGWGPGEPGKIDGKPRVLIAKEIASAKLPEKPTRAISNKDYAGISNSFDKSDLDKPWFFWYGSHEPHRRYEYGSGQNLGGKSIDDIDEVPGFWPDSEVVRNDMLDYGLEIEHADSHLLRMIKENAGGPRGVGEYPDTNDVRQRYAFP